VLRIAGQSDVNFEFEMVIITAALQWSFDRGNAIIV